jgi:SagB-type dehydrogenase family enzyme
MADSSTPDNLRTVYNYHDRTKHQLERYARSLGYMDWANQPDPFRRYEGAPLHRLERPGATAGPTYDSLFTVPPATQPLNKYSLSRLFFYSLALSAWKQILQPDGKVHSRWSLRVDPSSGNLHPTEGYLICGPVEGLNTEAGVYHYAPFEHGLELRRTLNKAPDLLPGALLVGLTSIHWREAWKYGERSFRYCQHDCGHAIGAITLSAACLGWSAQLVDSIETGSLSRLLGVDAQEGPEAEHADCLLLLAPEGASFSTGQLISDSGSEWFGTPNKLSGSHHPWEIIDQVSSATQSGGFPVAERNDLPPSEVLTDRDLSAHTIIRQRRSAVAMDGETSVGRDTFLRMLHRVMPQRTPFGVLPWAPAISLALFVHRVDGLEQGLYALVRDQSHFESLRKACRSEFLWEKPESCPKPLPLYLLVPADTGDAARTVSCHQDIASDGVFAAGMLARFDAALSSGGPAMYPRLFWETGLIGQVLYLEAEAAGIRATGIGCFFDDVLHQTLGITDHSWQSLYHFTVGGPVDDPRLQTLDAYQHLADRLY